MKSDEEFLRDVKQRLDSSANELDELTLARLGAARRRAVEAGSHNAVFRLRDTLALGPTGWIGLTIAGLLLILSLILFKPGYHPPEDQPQALSLMEDMELLGAAEELEFYQELDFYLWVADEQDAG